MPSRDVSSWPDCTTEQVQVMVLGTYHMDNPGLDEANVHADDVLSSRRQTELQALCEHLERWEPERIAVERPHDRSDELNNRYREYQKGERAYSHEERFPSPHQWRNDPATECRSEVVQIGFRLADSLGHSFVAAIDEHPDGDRYDDDPFTNRGTDSERKTTRRPRNLTRVKEQRDERLASSSMLEFHRWLNSESELYANHEGMFDRAIRATGEQFGSPLDLAYWYDRNVRMVHHLWQTMETDDERILLVVGSGHVRALRHLLTEAPMFCPVSPIEYL